MSFRDIMEAINDDAEKQYRRVEKAVTRESRKYEKYDDQQVATIYRNSSGLERAACAMVLRNRREESDR